MDSIIDRLVSLGVGYFKFDYNLDITQGIDLSNPAISNSSTSPSISSHVSPGNGLLEHNRAYLQPPLHALPTACNRKLFLRRPAHGLRDAINPSPAKDIRPRKRSALCVHRRQLGVSAARPGWREECADDHKFFALEGAFKWAS
jgi:hypothetical protein